MLNLFLHHVATQAQQSRARKGSEYFGTSAESVRCSLGAFESLTGMPFSPHLSDPAVTVLAAPRAMRVSCPRGATTLSVAAQLQLEWLAKTHPSQIVRTEAQVSALSVLLSQRGEETRRSKISSTEPPRGPADLFNVFCPEAKGPSRVNMAPYEACTFAEGFDGDASVWLSELARPCGTRPFLLGAFVAPRGKAGQILHATSWASPPKVISSDHFAKVWKDLLSLPPLRYTPEDLSESAFDMHAPTR